MPALIWETLGVTIVPVMTRAATTVVPSSPFGLSSSASSGRGRAVTGNDGRSATLGGEMSVYMRAVLADWQEPSFDDLAVFVARQGRYSMRALGNEPWVDFEAINATAKRC